jgi:hypothetical protein
MTDPECICKGNWRDIVQETERLIGTEFEAIYGWNAGKTYVFFGIVHTTDDYYYGMWSREDKDMILLSCVGSFEGHGFIPTTKCDKCKEPVSFGNLVVARQQLTPEEYYYAKEEYETVCEKCK